MTLFWLLAFVAFAIVEAATVQLVSIWFAIGSLAALIVSLFQGSVWLQAVCFLIVSAAALVLTKPLVKKMSKKHKATNADRIIGTICKVTEDIDNIAATGAVFVQGKTWTARSRTGEPIQADSLVLILAIEGVKLIVEPAGDTSIPDSQQ